MSESNLLAFDATVVVDQNATGDVAWPARYVVRDQQSNIIGGVDARRVTGNRLDGTYPIGSEDREILVHKGSTPGAIAASVHTILTDAPRCRRVVLAVPVGEIEAMLVAEAAGLRYVLDIDTHDESLSLLVAEPEWVLSQPSAMEDLPL